MEQPRFRKKFGKSKNFKHKNSFQKKDPLWKRTEEEINQLKKTYSETDFNSLKTFAECPLSDKTKKGLSLAEFTEPTKIQQQSLGLALQGHDILGAAKTGSGKTLAFILPILERLYSMRWSPQDGMGALIISPTRELAYQIFEVLRKVGRCHQFSAGLVIGGKHVDEEAERIHTTNILVATPGRLLQHMDETSYFTADNLQILVLDEADRILDLGFQQTMNSIIDNLPTTRQTLLYSATQTKSVRDLARLSLKDPMYVSVHENAEHSTPSQLQQSYVVCNIQDKINLLWSFIRHHLQQKTLVFMTSCKQVRFYYEIFRHMRPGVTITALHGAMQQSKRMEVYDGFCRAERAVLFATDIAARGLDFPKVNWVLQLDCPEDANTYIHRAGRTARFEKGGEALLVLLPSEEEAMVKHLETKKIPINKIKVNPRKQQSIHGRLQALLAADIQLKEFAQKAFTTYLKAMFLMKDKSVFDVTKIDHNTFANSLGLAIPPRVRFLERVLTAKKNVKKFDDDNIVEKPADKKIEKKKLSKTNTESTSKTGSSGTSSGASEGDSSSDDSDSDSEEPKQTKNPDSSLAFDIDEEDDDEFGGLLVKKTPATLERDSEASDSESEEEAETSKSNKKAISTKSIQITTAKKLQKKKIQVNKRVMFTEDGEVATDVHKQPQQEDSEGEEEEVGGINIALAKQRMQKEDKFDKDLYKLKIKQKHREKRLKEKEKKRAKKQPKGEDDEVEMTLGAPGSDSDEEGSEQDSVSGEGSEDGSSDAESSGDSDDESSAPKRRRTEPASDSEEEEDSEEEDGTETALGDDEALALSLLQSR